MKKIFSIVAVLIVAAASFAFIPTKEKKKALNPVLYIYQGTSTSGEDVASNYVQATQGEVDQLGCELGTVICWMKFDDDPLSIHPPISSGFDPRAEAEDYREKN